MQRGSVRLSAAGLRRAVLCLEKASVAALPVASWPGAMARTLPWGPNVGSRSWPDGSGAQWQSPSRPAGGRFQVSQTRV
eukprot:3097729-Rhodomonas_salina.2